MMGKVKLKEVDICRPAIKWLQDQHWDVYQEVSMGTRVDIVAVRCNIYWAIEAKTSLSTDVIYQALNNQNYFHLSSVLVPRKKHKRGQWHDPSEFICSKFGIGILRVDVNGNVFEKERPTPLRKNHHYVKNYLGKYLCDEQKTGDFGEAGNNHCNYLSPYKKTIRTITDILKHKGALTMKEILKELNGTHHYAHDRSANACLHKALTDWEDGFTYNYRGNQKVYQLK